MAYELKAQGSIKFWAATNTEGQFVTSDTSSTSSASYTCTCINASDFKGKIEGLSPDGDVELGLKPIFYDLLGLYPVNTYRKVSFEYERSAT